jgi:putative ABC transport system substrate-binding protein
MGIFLRRREFIAGLGTAAAWPLAAPAQQGERLRRVSVLGSLAESDPEGQARVAALARGVRGLGWTEGRNLRIEHRWIVGGGIDRIRAAVAEVVASNPDVVHATVTTIVQELQRQTRSIPIVFAGLTDPVETGVVASGTTRPPPGSRPMSLMAPSISASLRTGVMTGTTGSTPCQ